MADQKDAKSQKKRTPRQIMKRKKKALALKKKLTLSVPVPEGLKKAWERENRYTEFRKQSRENKMKYLPEKRKKQALRIQEYEAEYIRIKMEKQQNVKNARLNGNFFKEEDAKMAIVIRIRGYALSFFVVSDKEMCE